jgi:hypothetical protein
MCMASILVIRNGWMHVEYLYPCIMYRVKRLLIWVNKEKIYNLYSISQPSFLELFYQELSLFFSILSTYTSLTFSSIHLRVPNHYLTTYIPASPHTQRLPHIIYVHIIVCCPYYHHINNIMWSQEHHLNNLKLE